MKLAALLKTLPEVQTTGQLPGSIQALEYDSRRVAPDSLFIALRGAKVDGHKFAAQAAQRGAVAVVAEESLALPESCALLRVPDSRAAMADLAAAFLWSAGTSTETTGSHGHQWKTSVAFLLRHLLAAGRESLRHDRHRGIRFGRNALCRPREPRPNRSNCRRTWRPCVMQDAKWPSWR